MSEPAPAAWVEEKAHGGAGSETAGPAARDAHCHLWATNASLFDARRVLDAWGCGSPEPEVLEWAAAEGRVLFT